MVQTIGEDPQFSRKFICFAAQGDGSQHCRPFICLDGCHLKGPYEGVLLTAVTLDANSDVLPHAACIVDLEKNDTWQWFL